MLAVGCYAGVDSDDFEDRQFDDTTLEIIDNLEAAGFPDSEIGVLEDGTVFVGMDAIVTLGASREMAAQGDGFRQYRTNNLIDSSISVICIQGSEFTGTMSTALDNAIDAFNDEGLSFTLERRDNSDPGVGCDAEIYADRVGGSGGLAGFPEGGLPYGEINIGKSIANYGEPVVRHVIMHEIGHCIGFRHTDYFDRSISCGGGTSNEGEGGVGAVHIPGTPTGAVDGGSVMNSCYSTSSDGIWTSGDETALAALYGGGGGGGGGGGDGGGGPVCGDGTCDGGETCGSCESDCGACPVCEPKGASCSSNGDCCSNKCRGPGGNKSCK